MFEHPRFGVIKAVRATTAVAAGAEVLVDYGYTDETPAWWTKPKGPPPAPRALQTPLETL